MKHDDSFEKYFHLYIWPFIQECFIVLETILKFLLEFLSKPDYRHKGEFINANTLLSKSNKGFCIDGRRFLSAEHSQRNALIIGGTGFGKSSVIAVPLLLNLNASCICNDPSQELYNLTAGHLKSRGFEIKVINFSNANVSCGYNALERIQNFSDCQKIAAMLIRNALGTHGDPFWSLKAQSLLGLLLQILQHSEPQYRNFANVVRLLQIATTDGATADRIVAKTNSPKIIAEWKQWLALDAKVQSGITASVEAALTVFNDPIVAKVTSKDTLDIENMRKRKTVVFLHSSISDMKYYSVLISIIFEQITKVVMNKLPEKSDYPVYFLLDEMSSLYLPTIQIVVSNCRKYKSGIIGLLQSYQQLIDIYGAQDAESIRTNCFAKVYFGGQSHQTASELSQIMGKFSYTDEKGIERTRELKSAAEIRELDSSNAILIAANYKPILLNLTPYFKNPFLKLKTEIPAPILKGELPNGEIQLLDA